MEFSRRGEVGSDRVTRSSREDETVSAKPGPISVAAWLAPLATGWRGL
jgi:hypothetical protein